MTQATCYIGLGSNQGDRQLNLVAALELIGRIPRGSLGQVSRFVETAAVGGPTGQSSFLNAAAEIETFLSPHALLEHLLRIEGRLGRARVERWGPRTIDLDILLWGRERVRESGLTIPHPAMHFRRFVLEPLAEIAPQVRHPAGWTVAERWEQLRRRPHYLAITGPMGVGKTTLGRELAARLDAAFVGDEFDSLLVARYYNGDREKRGDVVQEFFLETRRKLLDRRRWIETPPEWLVTDFWFNQSLAYADALLDPAGCAEHSKMVQQSAADVLDPTLVVWLDADAQVLEKRVQERATGCESRVTRAFLAAIRDSYSRVLGDASAPPLYAARSNRADELVEELLVVAKAISG
jgi:2-amino-4-hydroxy-6-hydroxymethyldihydropteridine diphosphokinase